MTWHRLFSTCLFSHDDPIRDFRRTTTGEIVTPRVLVLRCSRCQMDLGAVCAGQRFTARKSKIKLRKRKSADVLTLRKKVAS